MNMMVKPQGMGSLSYEALANVLRIENEVMQSYYKNACEATTVEQKMIASSSDAAKRIGEDEYQSTFRQGLSGVIGGSVGLLGTVGATIGQVNAAKSVCAENKAIANIDESINKMKTPSAPGAIIGDARKFQSPDAIMKGLSEVDFKKESFNSPTKTNYTTVDAANATPQTKSLTKAEAAQSLSPEQKTELAATLERTKSKYTHDQKLAEVDEKKYSGYVQLSQSLVNISDSVGKLASADSQKEKGLDQAIQSAEQGTLDLAKSINSLSATGSQQAYDRMMKAEEDIKATIAASSRA